jgi:hypothetical protein
MPSALARLTFCGALAVAVPTHAASPTAEELERQIQELKAQVEALAREQERQSATAASPLARTHLGGYGELHYNNLDSKHDMDFHRFVLYLGHDFTDRVRFVSEIELEHSLAGDGTVPNGTKPKPGELELEQAYVEFDLAAGQQAKAGLFLVPVGILNETHEPTTFYGVERNPIESNILPTTWWEGGAARS